VIRTADGRDLCYADWGADDGFPILFLHGSPGCRLSVRSPEQVAQLGGRLITYDRPGNGRSDRLSGRTVIDCVSDVELIADALGLDEFVVVGYSAGSPHALAVGARLQKRALRIACYGAIAPLSELGLSAWSAFQDEETRDYVAVCLSGEEAMAERFGDMDAEYRAEASEDDPIGIAVLESTRDGVWGWVDDELATLALGWGFSVGEVAVPTAIFSNPADTVTPPNHAEWLANAIPSSSLITSRNALGHVAVDDPSTARGDIYTWLLGN
jgi:pimeloyl-ACP methyl ester carboxylesterase